MGSEYEIDDGIEHNTVTQAMAKPNLTDMQIYDARMFPRIVIDGKHYEWLEMLEVAENFPENFNANESMIIKQLLLDNEKMPYVEARAISHTVMSIGFTREGRMDAIEGLGHARENRENENRGLGING
jgi:hypothetical protein